MRIDTLLAGLALFAITACGSGGDDPDGSSQEPPTVTRDEQLLYTLEAGTEWIGAVGRDAQARATTPLARTYGATIAADHQGISAAIENAGAQAQLRPVESGLGVELVGAAESARTALQTMTGAGYDVAFVESAIRLQQRLRSAVERDLAALQNPQLRQLAEQTLPTLDAHIRRGRQLLPELRAAQASEAPALPADPLGTTGPSDSVGGRTPGQSVAAPSQPEPRDPPPDTIVLRPSLH